MKMGYDRISSKIKDGIQYGLIHLEDSEEVKFWFLTHHATSDIGGTIYEFSSGEKIFCSGFHCCEVQFYEKGRIGKTFKNVSELKKIITETDGISP